MLANIKLGVDPLDGSIMLYRHGADPRVALERRNAEIDVLSALVKHLFFDWEDDRIESDFMVDGVEYVMKVRRKF